MSADILFNKKRMWSARTAGFNEFVGRVRRSCSKHDKVIIEHLEFAESVSCLCIDDIKNKKERAKLLHYVLAASIDLLEELRADARTHPEELEGVRNLANLSRESLRELQTDPG